MTQHPIPVAFHESEQGQRALVFVPMPRESDTNHGCWAEGVRNADGSWHVAGIGHCHPTHVLPAPPNPLRVNEKLDPASHRRFPSLNMMIVRKSLDEHAAQPIADCPVGVGEWAMVWVPIPTPDCLYGGCWASAMLTNSGWWRTSERVYVQPTHWFPLPPNPFADYMPVSLPKLVQPHNN